MLIQPPQIGRWKQPNSVIPDPILSPPSPKQWLDQVSGGPVGLGIVAALHKSNRVNSQVKPIVSTSPVDVASLRPATCRAEPRQQKERCRVKDLFFLSPTRSSSKEIMVPAAHFLSHCSSCRKQQHGKDVYMYQDKAFCSIDCRYQQIVSDEMQEKSRRSKAAKSSCSPYTAHGRLFFTGI